MSIKAYKALVKLTGSQQADDVIGVSPSVLFHCPKLTKEYRMGVNESSTPIFIFKHGFEKELTNFLAGYNNIAGKAIAYECEIEEEDILNLRYAIYINSFHDEQLLQANTIEEIWKELYDVNKEFSERERFYTTDFSSSFLLLPPSTMVAKKITIVREMISWR